MGKQKRLLFKRFRSILGLLCLLVLTACQTTGPVEHAVVFVNLPPLVGGGLSERIIPPGTLTWLWPWERLYRLDTSIQSLSWGERGEKGRGSPDDYVQTRTRDGNEIGLVMTVQYQVDPQKLPYVIQKVATSNERIRAIVASLSRSDIRTHMNTLRTRDFISQSTDKRNLAVQEVQLALAHRLEPEGILVKQVIYKNHQFERVLPDGQVDQRYQDQVESTQATYQEAEQEQKKIKTVEEQKKREQNDAEGVINRLLEEAKGYDRQARMRGDGYFQVKQNEASQIEARGMAEVEGLKKKVEALSGAGGVALLRLEIIKALVEAQAKFVVLNMPKNSSGALSVNKLDTNEILKQVGVFSALSESPKTEPKQQQTSVESPPLDKVAESAQTPVTSRSNEQTQVKESKKNK